MTRRNADVQFTIKAKDEANRTVRNVAEAMALLNDAQSSVAASAGKTGNRLQQLTTNLTALETINRKLVGSAQASSDAIGRQAQALLETNRGINERKARVAELQRALGMLETQAAAALAGPDRDGLSLMIRNVKTELKSAQADIGRLGGNFDRQLKGLRDSRAAFREITSAQREADGATSAFTAEIATQTAALERNADAARRAQAAQKFFNTKFAPGLESAATSANEQQEIAAILRVAEARDREILKLREEKAAADAATAAHQRMARAKAAFQSRGSQDNGSVPLRAADTTLAKEMAAAEAEMREMRTEAERLRNALNPLAAVEAKLAAETVKVNRLFDAGAIDAKEYAAALKMLQADADRTVKILNGAQGLSADGQAAPFGLRPYEIQNLGYQVNDLFTQIASGTSVMQAAAQQGGQIVQIFPKVGSAIFKGFTSAPLLAFVGLLAAVAVGLRRVADDAQRLREFEGLLTAAGNGATYQSQALVNATRELDRYGLSAEDAVKSVRLLMKEGINPERFEDFGKAAQDMADVLGMDVTEALKLLVDGTTGGFEAVTKLQEATGLYTEAELERVKALYLAGRAEDARIAAYEIAQRKYGEGAAKARGPWADAARTLGTAWDVALTSLADSAPIQGLAEWFDKAATNALKLADAMSKLSTSDQIREGLGQAGEIWASPVAYLLRGGSAGPKPPANDQTGAQAAATAAAAAASTVRAKNDAKTEAANKRVTEDMRRQALAAKETTSELVLQQKLTEFRRKTLADLQNNDAYKDASDAAVAAAADVATAQERVKLERELTEYKKRQADEAARAAKEAASMVAQTKLLLKKEEGFKSKAYWDVNAWRNGFGSDTMTAPDGRVSAVTKSSTTTEAGANRDLERRIAELVETLKRELGAERYGAMSGQQQAAMASIAYNYGSLKATGKLDTFREGSADDIVTAIRSLGSHNGGVNAKRRNREADLFAQPNLALDASTAAVAEKKLEAQQKFNDEVDAENLKRKQTITLATQMQGLTGAALVDAEKARFVEEAVAAQRAKAAKDELTYTAAQEAATRALAAAEFEATRGAQARADAARTAADQPVEQLSALRGQLESSLQTANSGGQAGRANDLEIQLVAVNMKLREAATAALAFYSTVTVGTVAFPGTQTELDAIIAKLKVVRDTAQTLPTIFGVTGESIANAFASAGTNALDSFAQKLAEGENAFKSMGDAFRQFAADFLRQIAQMIIQAQLLAAAKAILNAIGVPVAHGGGVVGGAMGTSRSVSPAWFAGATRYHTGGVAGLRPNEVPAILERGEEVLTRDDPRHRINGGAGGGSAAPNIKIVNAIDASEALSAALDSKTGEKALLNFIRVNQGAVKAAMG